MIKNCNGISNNVWKFQVSMMKILPMASIWSSCVICIMTQCFHKGDNFDLRRRKKVILRIAHTTTLCCLVFNSDFQVFLTNIYKFFSKFLSIYYNYYYIFFNIPTTVCCEVFADVNAIYFAMFQGIMNASSGFETLKTQLLGKLILIIFLLWK